MTTPSIDNVSDEVAKLLADIGKDKSKAKQTREANQLEAAAGAQAIHDEPETVVETAR